MRGSCVALGVWRPWRLQVFGHAKPPNDELVDLQAPHPSTADRQASNGYCADGQRTDRQGAQPERAHSLRPDCKSTRTARAPAAKEAQGATLHRITGEPAARCLLSGHSASGGPVQARVDSRTRLSHCSTFKPRTNSHSISANSARCVTRRKGLFHSARSLPGKKNAWTKSTR